MELTTHTCTDACETSTGQPLVNIDGVPVRRLLFWTETCRRLTLITGAPYPTPVQTASEIQQETGCGSQYLQPATPNAEMATRQARTQTSSEARDSALDLDLTDQKVHTSMRGEQPQTKANSPVSQARDEGRKESNSNLIKSERKTRALVQDQGFLTKIEPTAIQRAANDK